MVVFMLLACVLTGGRPPDGGLPTVRDTSARPIGAPRLEPVSFQDLEARIAQLLADTTDADRRDRLIAARDLMLSMRNEDPAAQREVRTYLEQVLLIEERSRTEAIPPGDAPVVPVIEEEPLGADEPAAPAIPDVAVPAAPDVAAPDATASVEPPAPIEPVAVPVDVEQAPVEPPAPPVDPAVAVASARAALAESRYLDAVAALEGSATDEVDRLRREAIDGWARGERERAGRSFLDARAMPAGPARVAALLQVRASLDEINTRFPDNAYAAAIRENLVRVDADLAASGALP